MYGGICIFSSTGIKCKSNLNILDVVLRDGEYTVFHIGRLSTATEVHHLEVLVYLSTAISDNGTLADDVTVCIERRAVIQYNGAVLFHLDKACRVSRSTAVYGRAVCSKLLSRYTYSTVYGNLSSACHGESAVSINRSSVRSCRLFDRITLIRCQSLYLGSVHSTYIIEGDEKSHTRGNGIGTCRESRVVHKSESLVGAISRCSKSLVEIVVESSLTYLIVVELAKTEKACALRFLRSRAYCEPSCTAIYCESSLNSHIARRSEMIGCGGRDDSAITVGPTKEGGAVGSSNQGYAVSKANVKLSTRSHYRACGSNTTNRAVIVNGNLRTLLSNSQAKAAERKSSGSTG